MWISKFINLIFIVTLNVEKCEKSLIYWRNLMKFIKYIILKDKLILTLKIYFMVIYYIIKLNYFYLNYVFTNILQDI